MSASPRGATCSGPPGGWVPLRYIRATPGWPRPPLSDAANSPAPSVPEEPAPGGVDSGGPTGEADSDTPLGWLTAPVKPKKRRRDASFTVRLKPGERARIDRLAEVLGVTTAAYVRSRLLDPGPDVAAWRGAYQLLLSLVEDVAAAGAAPEVVARVREFQEGFEAHAASVFPQDEDE